MNRSLLAVTLFVGQCMISASAFAQTDWDQNPWLHAKFRLTPGVFFSTFDSSFRVNGSEGIENPDIELDEALQLSNSENRFAAELLWRYGEKWSVAFQYLYSDIGGTARLTQDIEWQDFVLREGTFATAGLESKVIRAFMGRKFYERDNLHFGLGAGLHWIELEAFVEGEFFLTEESTGFRRESVEAKAPLPNIGGWLDYAITPRWAITSRLDWLSISIGDYSGGMTNVAAGTNFQVSKHLAFGLNYNYFRINADIDKRGWRGGVKLESHGPFAYANFTW